MLGHRPLAVARQIAIWQIRKFFDEEPRIVFGHHKTVNDSIVDKLSSDRSRIAEIGDLNWCCPFSQGENTSACRVSAKVDDNVNMRFRNCISQLNVGHFLHIHNCVKRIVDTLAHFTLIIDRRREPNNVKPRPIM